METVEIKIARRKLEKLFRNTLKSAEVVNLVHVSDTQPGITRAREGDTFVYYKNNRRVRDKADLLRIRRLVLPPAWENVWICAQANGHLQATGIDKKGRKQYKYHEYWNHIRNHTKFSHLYDFGKALPQIRLQLKKDFALKSLPLEKVLATVVMLMQCTCIRIGNSFYEKLYGSYGLTTMKDKHVDIRGSDIRFSFKGKKGVFHNLSLKSRKLANIVQQCKDIPGKELFQYYDEEGRHKAIDSGMVNEYIKQISGGHFTAKDFRTWTGSLYALQAFKDVGQAETLNQAKKKIVEVLDIVAKQLGNTRAVCKKYYVHPSIIDHYTNKTLDKFLSKIDAITCSDDAELNPTEQVLMKILKSTPGVTI